MSSRRVSFIVGANIRNFEKGMKDVESRMHRVGRQATFLGRDLRNSVTMPLVAMGAGMVALAKQTGEYADQLLDLSEITGMTTDSLQEWRNVARVAGVDADALSNAASGLSRRIRGISEESGAGYIAAQRLGVSFKDAEGNLRDTDSVMSDLIGALGNMESGLERAGVANDLFGRRWEQIAPILGMSRQEIDALREQAHEMGAVMSGEALEAANEFRIQMEQFQERVKAAGRTVAVDFMPALTEMIPALEQMADNTLNLVRNFTQLDTEAQIQRIRMAALAAAIGPVLIFSGALITSMGKLLGLFRAMSVVMLKNPFVLAGAAIVALGAKMVTTRREAEKFRKEMEALVEGPVSADDYDILTQAIAKMSDRIDQATDNFTRNGQSLENLMDVEKKHLEDLNKQLERLIELRNQAADAGFDAHGPDNVPDGDVDEWSLERAIANTQSRRQSLGRMSEVSAPMGGFDNNMLESIDRMASDNFLAQQRETWDHMLNFSDDYSAKLDENGELMQKLEQDTINVGIATQEWAGLGVQLMDRMLFQGEKLSTMFKSIGRQLATRGFMALLSGGTSEFFGGSALGGLLGKVFNVNDALITSKGDVVNFHPDDNILAMKDLSKLGGGGSPGKVVIQNVLNLDGRVLYRSMKEVEYAMR